MGVFNATTNTPSTEIFNETAGVPNASSLENLEALDITNFALSSNGCNVKCVYANWARGMCQGTTCVCSGLKSSQPQYLPNVCKASRVPSGNNACNIQCVYGNWYRGTCSQNQCTCSGGGKPN